MGDIGLVSSELLVARAEFEVESQLLVIEGKELRLAEIDEEEERLAADSARLVAEAGPLGKQVAKLEDGSLAARRLNITIHGLEHAQRKNRLRLLELADERRDIANDIASSREHIARHEAEASQQKARLKERQDG